LQRPRRRTEKRGWLKRGWLKRGWLKRARLLGCAGCARGGLGIEHRAGRERPGEERGRR